MSNLQRKYKKVDSSWLSVLYSFSNTPASTEACFMSDQDANISTRDSLSKT